MATKPTIDFSWKEDDDDYELTPLESSDEESDAEQEPNPAPTPKPEAKEVVPIKTLRPSTQQATKQSKDRIAGNSSPYLQSPRTANYSLEALYGMMKAGTIDLDPEYQRAVVWTTTKQENLIDSVYHNFYVPPIIFATTTGEDGTVIRTCIDGKQRLTSMRLFMDGELSYKDSMNGNRSWFINPKGLRGKSLSKQRQQNFRLTQIACVEYHDITEEQQREIFQRVQMGVSLTPAERLQSANGPIADLIRNVRGTVNATEGIEGFLDWGKARGKDFKMLAEIAYLIIHGKQKTGFEPNIQRLDAFLDSKPHPGPAAKRREELLKELRHVFPNVMDVFRRILRYPELGEPLRNNISSLEFVMSAYLISVHRRLSDTKLSHAIAQMREFYRSLDDVKGDSSKRKQLLTFIHTTVPKLKLNSDGRDFAVPYQRVENRSKDASVEGTSGKPATKRKRSELEPAVHSSDDEPLLAKKLKVKPKRSGSISEVEGTSARPATKRRRSELERVVYSSDDEPLLIKKPKVNFPKRSSSISEAERKAIDTGRPSKPQASTSRPSLKSSASVSKAKTAVRRTPAKQHSSDVNQPAQVEAPPNKSEGFQVATPSSRMVSGSSQRVISRLGAQLLEPVALGRRAEAARMAAALPPTTPVGETPTPIHQKPPYLKGNSPVVQQGTLSRIAPSSGSVLPSDAPRMTGSFVRTRAVPDRLAPIRNAKAAVSRSANNTPASSPKLGTGDETDLRWQNGFADLLPAHSRTTEEWTAMVSSRVLAPSADVRMDGYRTSNNSSPIAPNFQGSGWSGNTSLG